MKDTKFVTLLLLVIIIGLINLIWLAKLQKKCDYLSSTKLTKDMIDADGLSYNDGLLKVDTIQTSNVITNLLQIIDKNENIRMEFNAFHAGTMVDFFDVNGKNVLSYADYGKESTDKSTLTLQSGKGVQIELSTFGAVTPTITIQDIYGRSVKIGSYGIIEFP
jgi:hypothetical protein